MVIITAMKITRFKEKYLCKLYETEIHITWTSRFVYMTYAPMVNRVSTVHETWRLNFTCNKSKLWPTFTFCFSTNGRSHKSLPELITLHFDTVVTTFLQMTGQLTLVQYCVVKLEEVVKFISTELQTWEHYWGQSHDLFKISAFNLTHLITN